jgi:hypothetical protein
LLSIATSANSVTAEAQIKDLMIWFIVITP